MMVIYRMYHKCIFLYRKLNINSNEAGVLDNLQVINDTNGYENMKIFFLSSLALIMNKPMLGRNFTYINF